MTFHTFCALAAKCRTLLDLERLFVDRRPEVTERIPNWRYIGLWNRHHDRIVGDGRTGEVCEPLPF